MKTTLDTEQAFNQVEKMLYKLAWDFSKRNDLPYDDCLSECYFAFVKALNWRFDPSKGTKFSTQVYTIAKWRLRSLLRRHFQEAPTEELNEETAGMAPPLRSACIEVVEGLSADAREIVALLLETPDELLVEIKSPKQLLSSVRQYLVKRGWTRQTWEDAHEEIEQAFRLVWRDGRYA